jgi:hypothetical protein
MFLSVIEGDRERTSVLPIERLANSELSLPLYLKCSVVENFRLSVFQKGFVLQIIAAEYLFFPAQ